MRRTVVGLLATLLVFVFLGSPTAAVAGHRLRVVVKTGDTPHLLPPPMKLPELLLGIYGIQRNATSPSWIDLQVAE